MKNRFKLITALTILMVVMVSFSAFAQEKDDSGKLKGKSLFDTKCKKCHPTIKATSRTKSPDGWKITVDRMMKKNPDWISEAEAKEITAYLSSKSLFDKKCIKCHGANRATTKTKDLNGWTSTVNRMKKKNPEWINKDEAKQIIDYLVTVSGK